MQLDFSLFTKPEPHESGDSAHTADFPDAQPLLDTNPTTTQKSSAPINFLDLDPFPNLHMHNMPPPLFEASSAGTSEEAEQEQWSRMHVGNMFFGQDAIHADDDIGLYFQD